ncbi:MAG: PAS domain S-box protein [Smithella sp.]
MTAPSKTKKELFEENQLLKQRIKELKQSESECEKIEETLREQEEKYRAFINTSKDCIFITSVDGQWLDLNSAAVQLFGYDSREELMKVQIKDLYANPDRRIEHLQIINEGIYSGKTVCLAEKRRHHHRRSYHFRRKKR